MNNYEFWENYLERIKKAILKLCNEKEELQIDFHIHSNYSADGKQSLNQILESTNKLGFDIIAITDHDNIDVYQELYEKVKNDLTTPLIIPGIEFTIDNKKYGNQCHFLQLFINPSDLAIKKNVEKNYKAMFNRSRIQFKRLKENKTITNILNTNKIKISYEEYLEYLKTNNFVPEYDTLSFYLIDKFKKKKITTFTILDLLEKDNNLDCYLDRLTYKKNRYQVLRNKYEINDNNLYNSRFLLSMLAVKEVDDDWWPKPSSGSLSVNSYGQLHINELNTKYKTFFAHPSEKSIEIVKKIIKDNPNIVGIEDNTRNYYDNRNNFNNLFKDNNLLRIIGSDTHDNTLKFYEDLTKYKIASKELKKIIRCCYD